MSLSSLLRSFKTTSLVLFLCLLLPHAAKAQAPVFTVKVKFSVQEGGLENALITITRNGAPYRVIDPSKGKYIIDLELGSEFLLTFTKKDHVTKSIIIDTKVPPGREDEEFAKFTAEVSLDKQPEDQIITYSQPVGRIKYSVASGDFDFDHDYTATAQAQQKKDIANAKPKPKDPEPAPKPETKPIPPPVIPPSNPIPVVVKEPEVKHEPEKPKPAPVVPPEPEKPVVKNKEESTIQKDRLKITIITVTINEHTFEYKREEYSWGGTYYYKDGKNITEGTFEMETE